MSPRAASLRNVSIYFLALVIVCLCRYLHAYPVSCPSLFRILHSRAVTSGQRRSFSPDTEALAMSHGARRSSPHFFEPVQASNYSSANFALSRASPTFFDTGAHDSGTAVIDVPDSPQRVSPLYGSRDQKRSVVGGTPCCLRVIFCFTHEHIYSLFIDRSNPSYSPQFRACIPWQP